jgi:hypothetical protein
MHKHILVISGFFLFVLTSCAKTAVSLDVSQPPASAGVAATPASPTAAAVVPTEPTADSCLACHADKQQLIDTAKPAEEKVKESEGAG